MACDALGDDGKVEMPEIEGMSAWSTDLLMILSIKFLERLSDGLEQYRLNRWASVTPSNCGEQFAKQLRAVLLPELRRQSCKSSGSKISCVPSAGKQPGRSDVNCMVTMQYDHNPDTCLAFLAERPL